MRKLFFFFVLPLFAEVSVSPTSLSYRFVSVEAYPGYRSLQPTKQLLTITTSGAWTIALSGDLNTQCLFTTACLYFSGQYDNTPITSGSGNAIVAVNWYGQQPLDQAPGTYTGTITVDPASGPNVEIPVSVVLVSPNEGLPQFSATSIGGTSNCAASANAGYTFDVRCTIDNEAPIAAASLTQPAVGATFVDPQFGGTITRLTAAGCFTEYGTTTAFSKDSTYILTSCGIYQRSNSTLIRAFSEMPGNITRMTMSATDDQVIDVMIGATLRTYNFVTDTETTIANYATSPYSFTEISAGGTAQESDDGWLAFYEAAGPANPKICAVNIPELISDGAPNNSNTFCGTYTGDIELTQLDWVGVSAIDLVSQKRYVYLSSVPLSMNFTVEADGVLALDFIVPEWRGYPQNNDNTICLAAELCYNASVFTHLSLFRDSDGQIKLLGNFQDILFVRYYVATYQLNKGLAGFMQQTSNGGSLELLGRNEYDRQPGCSQTIAGCVLAMLDLTPRYASRISAATAGSPTTFTVTAGHGWTGTRVVRIENATSPWTCLNGLHTATIVNSTTFTIPETCMGATGSPTGAFVGDGVQLYSGTQNDNRSQIQVWRPGNQVHRIAMQRSINWWDYSSSNPGAWSYQTTPRASISRDGQYVAFTSNWGTLETSDGELNPSVYWVNTGLNTAATKLTLKTVTPGNTYAGINYLIGSGGSCTILVDDDITFQSPVQTINDTGTNSRTTLLGPLTANTPYFVRDTCGYQVEARAFRTLPTVSATAKNVVTKIGDAKDATIANAAIEYRVAGDVSFSATSNVSCATGCSITWAGTANRVWEYRILYKNGGGTAVITTGIRNVVVQ